MQMAHTRVTRHGVNAGRRGGGAARETETPATRPPPHPGGTRGGPTRAGGARGAARARASGARARTRGGGAAGQLLIRVHACAVCRTDLHLLDGEVEIAAPPRILGHQIVGTVEARGEDANHPQAAAALQVGDRAGVPWLGWTDGTCEYCTSGRENLCPNARFTGRDIDGGYAEYTVADERFCFPIPASYADEQATPLLCAGLIGYRALRMTGQARRLGFYGFGDSAHILAQIARWQGREVYAFTRPGAGEAAQAFARELGAVWAGPSDEEPP